MRALLVAVLATASCLQAQPGIQRFTLPNGMQVLLLEDHEHPIIRARLHLRIEPGDAPEGRQGLPALLLGVLDHSQAADLKAEDFDRTLEDSGIQLTDFAAPGSLGWRLTARSRDQDRAMGLLADRLLRTVLLPWALEGQRTAARRQEEPSLAGLRQALLLDAASRPNLSTLGPITLADLLAFRARVFRPDRAVLVLQGDLGLEQAKRLVLLTLGSWTAQVPSSAEPRQAVVAAQPPANLPERLSVALPGQGLHVLVVAPRPKALSPEVGDLLGLLLPGDADLSPVGVAIDGGDMVATLSTGASGASAWSLLQGRLEAIRRRGFGQADLDRARSAWTAQRSLDSLHPGAQMEAALANALGRGVTPERVNAVSLDALNAGLRMWLDPAGFRSGAAGDPELLKGLPTP